MTHVLVLILAAAFSWAAAGSLRRRPWAYYLCAAVLSVLAIVALYETAPSSVLHELADWVQKGYVGFSLLTVVMFVGAFPKEGKVRRRLGPVRGELSIIAALFMVAHMVPYVSGYLNMLGFMGSLRPSMRVSLVIAIILAVLLLVLSVTSVKAIRRAMDTKVWKGVQRFAYLFYLLAFAHLFGFLVVPMMAGSAVAGWTLAYYGVILVAYLVLRVYRALADSRSAAPAATATAAVETSIGETAAAATPAGEVGVQLNEKER